jgi:hypothetical protein
VRFLVALLLLAAPAAAQELWNWFVWEAFDNGKFRVRGFGQVRSQPQFDKFLRAQGGPILEWQYSKRLNLIAGYYFQEFRNRTNDPEMQGAHRPFGGFEYAFLQGRYTGETRHYIEYFKALQGVDSVRGRARVRFEFPWVLQPFAQSECFYDSQGVQAWRNETGIAYNIAPWLEVQLGAFHETRPERTGGNRTVIVTRLTLDKPWGKR